MTAQGFASPGRSTARLLICLGVLPAVFAMHGPIANHVAPMPVHNQARVAVSGPMANSQHGMSQADEAVVTSPGSSPQMRQTSAAPSVGMSHGECVATLRPPCGTVTARVPVALTPPAAARAAAASTTRAGAASRARPPPTLWTVCICRT